MQTYEYGRIRKLAEELENANIASGIIDSIMDGGESIKKGTTPEKKADWFNGAMRRMDKLLDAGTRRAVREACACCLGGKRLKMSKAIARDHGTLEDRISAANDAKFVFGHGVELQADGKILVSFAPEGKESYRCVCLPKAKEPLPITYCYCCGGHAKHHLQTALGSELEMKVRSSALSSGGKRPCTFLFTLRSG